MTQKDVARAVTRLTPGRGYEAGWLANIEGGRTSMRLDAAIALAEVLDCSLDYLFGRSQVVGVARVGTDGQRSA